MRIAVLNPSYDGSSSPFSGHDPVCDPSRYGPGHTWERIAIQKATVGRQLKDLARRGFDVVVNLCDGAWDEDRAGVDVVLGLEMLGIPFTGATSRFYEPTRETMKRVCHYWDIPTPRFVFVAREADLDLAAELRFPLIVKHESSYGSIGMTRESRVESREALVARAREMLEAFGGALVEEFVEGREFTVLVAENPDDPGAPIAFQSVECSFPDGESFKHFDLKWVDFEGIAWRPVEDAALDERLRDVATRMFLGIHGTGYGRCDLRMAADGTLHMLEINPNCGIFYPDDAFGSADEILAHDPRGHTFFLDTILRSALARHARQVPVWEIRPAHGGYATFARVDLRAGDRIQRGEHQPHPLATRRHVERTWGPRERAWFERYAYPLTDEVFVTWDDDPSAWRPIDHSCDPNAWMDGLDLVARRDIAAGEPITVDYATFCGDGMAAFECRCGSSACRGTIRGTDYQLPAIAAYGDHVSDWVRRRRGRA